MRAAARAGSSLGRTRWRFRALGILSGVCENMQVLGMQHHDIWEQLAHVALSTIFSCDQFLLLGLKHDLLSFAYGMPLPQRCSTTHVPSTSIHGPDRPAFPRGFLLRFASSTAPARPAQAGSPTARQLPVLAQSPSMLAAHCTFSCEHGEAWHAQDVMPTLALPSYAVFLLPFMISLPLYSDGPYRVPAAFPVTAVTTAWGKMMLFVVIPVSVVIIYV